MEVPNLFFTFTVFFFLMISPAAVAGDQERDRILKLPGEPPNVKFSQFSGFITVDEKDDHQLFYWLVESPTNPSSKPLVMWLNGGPGCSSVAFGAFEEVGPFRVQPDGRTLTLAPHAWNKDANILFLDSPVGVGFSKSRHSPETEKIGDKRTAEEAYTFLLKWLERFPQYNLRPFYIAGESYAGHYIPQLSQIIVRRSRELEHPALNFKGFLLGNGVLDDHYDNIGQYEYWWSHGLVSDGTFSALKRFCVKDTSDIQCHDALGRAGLEAGLIDPYDMRKTRCDEGGSLKNKLRHTLAWRGKEECAVSHTPKYMNNVSVQRAFHVITNNTPRLWDSCKYTVEEAYTFLVKWLERFPQYNLRPFYIAGESYAGHYIPQLSQIIVRRSRGLEHPVLNFKGFLLGNGVLDDHYDSIGQYEYWWSHGLVSDGTYSALKRFCVKETSDMQCYDALERAGLEAGEIDLYDMRKTRCGEGGFVKNKLCAVSHTPKYMNNVFVQRAFHAITNNTPQLWDSCNNDLNRNWTDAPKTMLPILKELIAARIRIWIYSGDMDTTVPMTGTRYSIGALKLKTKLNWRAWYNKLEVGGWTETYEGLTLVIVKGAGHEVPLTQPAAAQKLLSNFLQGKPLPSQKTQRN